MTTYEQVVEQIAPYLEGGWSPSAKSGTKLLLSNRFEVNGKTYRVAIVEDVQGILSRDTCADMVINPHCYPKELKEGE